MHTKEPWFYGGTEVKTKDDLLRIFSESLDSHVGELGQYFLEIYTEDGKRIAFIAGPTAHANALRISACVNACDGIPTEKLEGDGIWTSFSAEMKQQRDEILAALKWAIKQMPEPSLPGGYFDGYQIARAAIAKSDLTQ